ncbi:MAG: hypothetical protein ACRELZ_23805 [Candidatus Rokuibacteriota bacterium]
MSRLCVVLLALLTGAASGVNAADDPVIDPDVRTAIGAAPARVLVDLRVSRPDPSAIEGLQDEVLRRLAGTGARLARRFSSAPMLALEIDAAALARLEVMRDLVARVRLDRIVPRSEDRAPRR